MHHIDNHTGITVAIVKREQDWQRIIHSQQYHIPERYSASVIQSSWVAWYMPGWYSNQPHCVRYVSHISNLQIMCRRDYIPDEPHHPHAHHLYAILTFDALYELRSPLTSQHWRRIGIYATTWGALTRAYDLSALTQVTRRMRTHPSLTHDSYELFDLCIPMTATSLTPPLKLHAHAAHHKRRKSCI